MTNSPRISFSRPKSKPAVISLASITVVGLLLSGCAATTPAPDSTASTSAPVTVDPNSGEIVQAATAFAATLDADQLAAVNQQYTFTNAQAWSNLPQALSRNRIGLQLSTLNETQITALDALLAAASGSAAGEGFDEIQQLLNADDYLADNGGGSDYGRGNYFVAFLGAPTDSGTWQLQFGGHHLAFANTYTDGALAGATPSFRAAEPFEVFEANNVSNAPLKSEQVALATMLSSLTSDQLATAQLSGRYRDLILTPGNDWAFPAEHEGIKVSTLSAEQKTAVLTAISTYVNDINDADAALILAKYESELDETFVSYSGTATVLEQGDYVRIDGPSVWIEYSVQRGIVLSGNHPHSVWRDRTTDYGGTQQ